MGGERESMLVKFLPARNPGNSAPLLEEWHGCPCLASHQSCPRDGLQLSAMWLAQIVTVYNISVDSRQVGDPILFVPQFSNSATSSHLNKLGKFPERRYLCVLEGQPRFLSPVLFFH